VDRTKDFVPNLDITRAPSRNNGQRAR
jgi:hypothetical protein